MKSLFVGILMLFSFTIVNAQTKVHKVNGKMVNVADTTSAVDTPYGDVYHNKGIDYPIYVTKKGRTYVNMVSKKTGKPYKKYITITSQ